MNIRAYQNGDEIGINNLHNSVFNDNRTIERWNWEFKDNPLGKTIFIVLEDDKQIKGSQSLIPAYLNIKGNKVYSAKSEATVLDPDYRGRDLFKEMYELAFNEARKENIKLIWGFTKTAISPVRKIGFDATTPISLMWYVNSIGIAWSYLRCKYISKKRHKLISSTIMFIVLLLFRLRAILSGLKKSDYKLNKMFSVWQLDGFNDDTDILFERFIRDFPDIITLWRDKQDLEWRAISNPSGKTHIFGLFAEQKLVGYASTIFNQAERILIIQDIIVRKQYLRLGTVCLLNKIKSFAKEVNAGLIRNQLVLSECIISRNNSRYFLNAGFCVLPVKSATVIKIMDEKMDKDFILNVDNWYITGLFTEGF